jgi:hypothetical protein
VGERQPAKAARTIERLVRARHYDQVRRLRVGFLGMVEGLSEPELRSRLLTLDLVDLAVADRLRTAALQPVPDLVMPRIEPKAPTTSAMLPEPDVCPVCRHRAAAD